ncbi:MAG TPA: LLM class flavin-dependent oxidoreductase [Thermomicrobiales bacterium]|nr:LLM class flavin-dependent oxidoreductase [Thermomicrobiales bacterium]
MKFSHFFNFDALPELSTEELLDDVTYLAILADRLGFDAIYMAEHHFTEYGRMPAPLHYLAYLAGLTERIDLGVAVIEAPYCHPLKLAEEAALVDRLSGGRLRLGIGSGAANKPLEFERFGIPLEEKGPRALEVIEIVRQALADNRVDFQGSYFAFADVEFSVRPIRPSSDLIWLAASTRSAEYAGRHAMPFMLPRPVPEAKNHETLAMYRSALPEDQLGYVTALRFIFVGDSKREALDMARTTFRRYAKYDAGVDWDGRTSGAEYDALCQRLKFIAGTADEVEAQIRDWADDLGAHEIMTQMYAAGTRREDAQRSMKLFARDVMPRFT